MEYLEAYKINSSGVLGTKVKLELLYVEEPSAITISVFDPSGDEVIDDVAGTAGTVGRYITYSYQSDTDNSGGFYKFRVKATFADGAFDRQVLEFPLKDYELE